MTEFGIGLLAVVVASAVLLLSVTQEFAPAGGLTGRGRWLLAAGLGAGVIAFAFKLTVIGLIALAPEAVFRSHGETREPAALGPTAAPRSVGEAAVIARYRWQALPRVAPSPLENPATPEKIALGEQLFFDKNLSLDHQVACASCHDLYASAGADGRRVARGIGAQEGERNAPTVWNAAFQSRLFWDGRAESLEAQARGPLLHPREMGMPSTSAVLERVREQPAYALAFERAFGASGEIGIDQVVAAIASYERSLITPDSPYDRFVRGDASALDAQQLRGMALFESVGCTQCHSGPAFSGASVFEASAPYRAFPAYAMPETDRLQLTRDPGRAAPGSERGVWRIPSLRNVALTAPYFHNGSVDTLEEAVRIMARGQLRLPVGDDAPPVPMVVWSRHDEAAQLASQPRLTNADVQAIVAFLESLSGDELMRRAAKPRPASLARE
jgi:cytochrome c peroxidase